MSRPPTSPPPSPSPTPSPTPPSTGAGDPPDRAKSGVPGAKALAWAVVGLAALRKRKDQTTVRRAHADPFRPRPPRPAGPGSPDANGQVAKNHQSPRSFFMLTELNTKPGVKYLARRRIAQLRGQGKG